MTELALPPPAAAAAATAAAAASRRVRLAALSADGLGTPVASAAFSAGGEVLAVIGADGRAAVAAALFDARRAGGAPRVTAA